jgi:hypothetical protein
MTVRTAARLFAACIVGLSLAGTVHASRFGGRGGGGGGGGHVVASPGFHHHGGFHTRVFIGGGFFAPWYWPPPPYYYPPAYYPPAYYPADPAYAEPYAEPAPSYWYYCPASRAYYPYVQECPGGWQQVAPQPPQ